MGRGNTCVFGKYEGLYYIDKDFTEVYRKENEFDDDTYACMGELDYNDITSGEWHYSYSLIEEYIDEFLRKFVKHYKAFTRPCKTKYYNDGEVILESRLFYIVLEDNMWSYAVKLIQKQPVYDEYTYEGLQRQHYKRYLDGIKNVLLDIFPEIGTYSGAWTSGVIKRG